MDIDPQLPHAKQLALQSGSGTKRPGPDSQAASGSDASAIVLAKRAKTDAGDTPSDGDGERPVHDYVEKARLLLNIDINPVYIDNLKSNNELGYTQLPGKRKLKTVHVEMNIPVWQSAIKTVAEEFLKQMYLEQNRLSDAEIVAEVNDMVPLVVDTTMNAIYARLRVIHKLDGEHAGRFTAPPSYNKDIELPLPLANAVQELGPFETQDIADKVILCPVYPANTLNEGRKTQVYSAFGYVSLTSSLRELNIPMKSVNTQMRSGSAWWTYKVILNNNKSDLQCTLPPCHYSLHSAILRGVFLTDPVPDEDPKQLIKFDKLDKDYGTMLRECGIGYNVRAMCALSHTRDEDWNRNMDK